jgi:PAS domain S-box-containing protein
MPLRHQRPFSERNPRTSLAICALAIAATRTCDARITSGRGLVESEERVAQARTTGEMADGVEPTDDRLEIEEVLEAAHEAYVAIDEHGFVTAWNREAERTFGWVRQVAVGSLLRDLIIPARYRRQHDRGLRRFLETGSGPLIDKRIEIAALHRNGHEFPVELTISALRHGSGWRFAAFVHDITDRYRASEFQARLATIVEHSADAIVARTRDGRVTAWNPAAEGLFGYSADEMLGQTLDRLLPADRRGEVQELLSVVLRGEPVQDVETVRVAKDGQPLDVSLTMSPIRDDAGEVVEVSMIIRDIGGRKRAERAIERARAELARAVQMKSEFVAIASHELRTPLTSISGFAKTILERWETLTDADKRRYLAIVDQQADRLRRLVDNVLLLARVEDQTMRPQAAPVAVAEAARAVLVERRAEQLFELDADDQAVAHADPDHVRQILVNYVANALAYGSPPFNLDIRRGGGVVTVRVRDAGPGIPVAFAPRLFETFARATKEPAGSGLGLAIVKRLALAAGGDAWHEPNNPQGACFCVSFPAVR